MMVIPETATPLVFNISQKILIPTSKGFYWYKYLKNHILLLNYKSNNFLNFILDRPKIIYIIIYLLKENKVYNGILLEKIFCNQAWFREKPRIFAWSFVIFEIKKIIWKKKKTG